MKVLSYKRRLTVTAESDGGGKFDISFNDLDKEYYPRCAGSGVEQSAPLRPVYNRERFVVGPGAEENDRDKDKDTRAIQEFNQRLYAMKEFFTTIVPLRDGLAVAVKA
jgi:caffeoyl-CoA O-methyltransferase